MLHAWSCASKRASIVGFCCSVLHPLLSGGTALSSLCVCDVLYGQADTVVLHSEQDYFLQNNLVFFMRVHVCFCRCAVSDIDIHASTVFIFVRNPTCG
jgi:hypothetical protein